jgi:vancomycin resistance protein YoaR
VFVQLKDIAGVDPDSFEEPIAVKVSVVGYGNRSFFQRHHFAVEPNQFRHGNILPLLPSKTKRVLLNLPTDILLSEIIVKFVFGIAGSVILASGGYVGIVAKGLTEVLPPGSVVGVVPVGGLSITDAQKRVRLYWESEKTREISLTSKQIPALTGSYPVTKLGLILDDVASVKQIAFEDFMQSAARTIGKGEEIQKVPFVFRVDPQSSKFFIDKVKDNAPPVSPAKIKYESGKIIRIYEQTSLAFDSESFVKLVPEAFLAGTSLEIPLKEAEKEIPDTELDKVKEVYATFSTNFPTHKVTRCQNIKLAASLIDGHLMMPGEKFDFNQVVGQRTVARGFKEAGIFNNGKHDTGIGGGICQVSTTLYNAALMGGLKIVQRQPHSMSVPYVPIGRDCVVSYPSLNLVFENNMDHPVAVDAEYVPGKLTFRLLGIKEPGLTVEIERSRVKSWGRGVRYEHDPSLGFGVTKFVDAGGLAHEVSTWRVFKKGGKVIKRESLGVSKYAGAPRTYARNLKARKPAPTPTAAPDTIPTTTVPETPELPSQADQ